MLAKKLWDIDPDVTPENWHARRAWLASEGNQIFEAGYRKGDGSVIPVEVSVYRLRHGNEELYCRFAREISARKEAEETARIGEERLRQLADASFDTILEMRGGEIVFASDSAASFYGYDPGALLGTDIIDLVAPESRGTVSKAIGAAAEGMFESVHLKKKRDECPGRGLGEDLRPRIGNLPARRSA